MPSLAEVSQRLLTQVDQVVAGKTDQVRLAWVALLCDGHVLLEDLPGVGKTTLAQSLATLLGLQYQRVQFTADLLPADVIGAQIFDREKQAFRFHRGPVFTQLLLADELNRATPKAQSALLEAMEERQVTIDGQAEALPSPFFVIATQNPQSQAGTYPLPESQLDRFFLRISLGYPSADVEASLLNGEVGRGNLAKLQPLFDAEAFQQLRNKVASVTMSDAVVAYIMRLVHKTRDSAVCAAGLSPRASQALASAARAYAATHGRDYVVPDDVQAVFTAVAGHRLKPLRAQTQEGLAEHILEIVDVVGD